MDKIDSHIYLGNWKEARVSETLIRAGVTAVLNVAHDHADQPMDELLFFKCGMVDGSWSRNKVALAAAMSLLDSLLMVGEIVFIHCINGFSRAPFVAAYYLAQRDDTNWNKEFEKIKTIRPVTAGKPWMDELHEEISQWKLLSGKTS